MIGPRPGTGDEGELRGPSNYWLDEALRSEDPAAAAARILIGAIDADVCVVGGGYVGLWTAIRIKERDPAVEVVVVERDICGAGASGRNGGFVLSWWPKLESLRKLCGPEDARTIVRQSEDAIREISHFCRRTGIDAHVREEGWLWAATNERQLGAWTSTLEAAAAFGEEPFRVLTRDETEAMAGSSSHIGGVWEACAATLQPALLARGLRSVAASLGVRIFERSPMRRIEAAVAPTVVTDKGRVRAGRIVVALNAWAAGLRGLRRSLVPIGSDMAVTEAAPDRLEACGLTHGIGISDAKLLLNFHRTTLDSRIAFGKALGQLTFAGRVRRRYDGPSSRGKELIGSFRDLYPVLADVPVTTTWHGPIDRSYDGLPFFMRYSGNERVLVGAGFSGNGVAPAVLAGHILSALALGVDDQWSRSPLVRQPPGPFPPEPIRGLGGILVRGASKRKDARDTHGQTASWIDRKLLGFAPPGLAPVRD